MNIKSLRSVIAAEGLRYDFGTAEGDAAIDASGFRGVLKALKEATTYQILPTDLRMIIYQPVRRGGKIVSVILEDRGGELGNFTAPLSEREAQMWGHVSLEEVIAVLEQHGAHLRTRRAPRPRGQNFSIYD